MPLLDCDLSTAKKLFDVNVFGVIGAIQTFSSLLIAAQGTIVIIGSVGGVLPYPFGGISFPFACLINQKGIYGASKSAVMYLADTLRFEMYPFNVKVVNVCTGGVKSQISKNATKNYNQTLPRDSLYLPIEQQFKAAETSRLEDFIDPKVYARYVITKVNKATKSGWIWKGAFSSTIWFVTTFLWKTVLDSTQLKENGLKKLRSDIVGKIKSE
jgi:1-acylglycerone phosphate reductase